MRKIDEGWRHHQPAAARRRDGFRALARQALDRVVAERRPAAAQGTMGFHAEQRQVVRQTPPFERLALPCRTAQTSLYVAAPRLKRPSSSGLGHRPFTAETRVRV